MSAITAAKLQISDQLFQRLKECGEAAYPDEGCGVLIGSNAAGAVIVSAVLAGRNLVEDRSRDRYELDPRDIIRGEREARASGQEVVGFYHTHPDHPARPSQFDTERAWPGYHYVVMSVTNQRLIRATAWRLVDGEEPNRFEEVPFEAGDLGQGYNPPGLVAEVP